MTEAAFTFADIVMLAGIKRQLAAISASYELLTERNIIDGCAEVNP